MERRLSEPSELIKIFRSTLDLSQGEFAEKLGYTQGYIADLERGRQRPSRKFWEKLTQAFKGSSTEILNRSISYKWDQIEETLSSEGLSSKSVQKIQDHILSVLDLDEERSHQKKLEKTTVHKEEPIAAHEAKPISKRKLLRDVREILESGNEVIIDALMTNIKTFLKIIHAIKK
jgi:transcriptional regulator with XRE-family HTH domain